ncbi:MAG: hypothetical protein AB1921_03775 [Thermodesulfobacteriota bacterium]
MAVLSNAILYKDTTQWLRGRFFAALFFGLLGVSEFLCLSIVLGAEGQEGLGRYVFDALNYCLGFYLLCVAVMGHNMAVKEFENRTFELYELSGMSLEKMVGGKLASLFYQFVFGFFCVVPFLFFCFYLGGTSFSSIARTAAVFLLAAPYFLLSSLFSALISRTRAVSSFGRAAVFALMVIVVPLFAEGLLILPRGFLGFMPWWTWISGLAGYLLVCLLLFYLCCSLVSPSTDSRELPIKFILTLLYALMLLLGVPAGSSLFGTSSLLGPASVPVFFLVLILGFFSVYRPAGVPLMARVRKRKRRSRILRAVFWFFEPGPAGAVRTLFLICAITALHDLWAGRLLGPVGIAVKARGGTPFLGVSYAIFHLAFPGGLLMAVPLLERRNNLVRAVCMVFWVMGAVLAGMLLSLHVISGSEKGLVAFLSPFMSMYALLDFTQRQFAGGPWPGMAALVFLWLMARMRERRHGRMAKAGEPS